MNLIVADSDFQTIIHVESGGKVYAVEVRRCKGFEAQTSVRNLNSRSYAPAYLREGSQQFVAIIARALFPGAIQ